MNVNPRRSASSISLVDSSDVVVTGFSTKICLPAASAAIARSKCAATGVAIAIASISGFCRSSLGSVVTAAAGCRRSA